MSSNNYKPVGWRNESYRHYLASKGIQTRKYNARDPLKLSLGASLFTGALQSSVGSQDPSEESSRRFRDFELQRRKGASAVGALESSRLQARAKVETLPVVESRLSEDERKLQTELVKQTRAGETEAERVRRIKFQETFRAANKEEQELTSLLEMQKAADMASRSQILADIEAQKKSIALRTDIPSDVKQNQINSLNKKRERVLSEGVSRKSILLANRLSSIRRKLTYLKTPRERVLR